MALATRGGGRPNKEELVPSKREPQSTFEPDEEELRDGLQGFGRRPSQVDAAALENEVVDVDRQADAVQGMVAAVGKPEAVHLLKEVSAHQEGGHGASRCHTAVGDDRA